MAPFSHEKVAEPPNLQSLRGAITTARTPFSITTMRKYVEVWETQYGQLPLDGLGHTRLVEPMVRIFTMAFQLRENSSSTIQSRLQSVIDPNPTMLLEVISAYNRCPNRYELAGVEQLTERLTIRSLQMLAAQLQELRAEQAKSQRLQETHTKELRQYLFGEMATWAKLQSGDVEQIVKATQAHARKLEFVAEFLAEVANGNPAEGSNFP